MMVNESDYLGLARRIVGDLTGRDWPTKSEEVARMLARNCQDAATITALQADLERLTELLQTAMRDLNAHKDALAQASAEIAELRAES